MLFYKLIIASLSFLAVIAPESVCAQEDLRSANSQDWDSTSQDWLAVGIGVISAPTYSGSDKSNFIIGAAAMGRVEGFNISPRVAGLAVDLVRDDSKPVNFTFGPVVRARFDRTSSDLKDTAVEALGKLDTAIEAGFVAGVGFSKVLNDYDRVDIGTDVRWDLAGAHKGMIVTPTVAYQTPLSKGAALRLSASADYFSGKTSRYYWSVTSAQSIASGLPAYRAKSGVNGVSLLSLAIIDLNGNLIDGGFTIYAGGGYQRLTGSADNSSITRLRGKPDQFFGGIGVGYTFN